MFTVSHELKTPLTAIRMATHMLADTESFGPLSDRQSVLLATARDNADRLYRTVEHLLGIGRLESGRAPLRLQPVPAADVITQAVDPLRRCSPAAVSTSSRPTPRRRRTWPSWPTRLGGLRPDQPADQRRPPRPAGDGGGGRVRTRRRRRRAGRVGQVRRRDAGPGIAPEHVPHLFDKFYRVPGGGTGGPGGAGLGLAIVRDVVHAHGGRAGVDTAPGRGATFWFCFRRA